MDVPHRDQVARLKGLPMLAVRSLILTSPVVTTVIASAVIVAPFVPLDWQGNPPGNRTS